MFYQHITAADIEYRQQSVRNGFIASRRIISVRGLRELIGNTLIQVGASIHGTARSACRDVAETRDLLRESSQEWRASSANRSVTTG